jgi:DNA-binding transcriptional MerR regulator
MELLSGLKSLTQSKYEFVNRGEAKRILSISDSTLQRWTILGLINKHKVRGRVYYNRKELNELIQSNLQVNII